ncbi:MAG: GNAT family N-acetyltransferase [Candidatus Shapirobacteria bacterium]
MIKIIPENYHDPCMQAGSWIYVDCCHLPENQIISSLDKYLSSAHQLLAEQNLKMTLLDFDYTYQALPPILTQKGFQPILHTWQLNLKNRPSYPVTVPLSPDLPAFQTISSLLSQQADYHHQLYPDFYKSWTEINQSEYASYLASETAKPDSFALTCFDENKTPLGFIWGCINQSHQAFIWELIVDQQHRGRGLGHALINGFIQLCQNHQVDTLEVETGHTQPANNFYQKIGFLPVAQTWYQII